MDIFTTATGHDLPYIVTQDGKVRFLARTKPILSTAKRAARPDPASLLPMSQWEEFDRTVDTLPLLDQGQVGECTGEAGVNTLSITRFHAGQTLELLSGSMLYSQVNKDVDEGANLGDVVQALQTRGVCLASEVAEGFHKFDDIPASALQTASRFMAPPEGWASFTKFAEAGSFAQMGYQLYISVTADGNWDASNFSSDGVPPFIKGSGNHAQSGGEAMKRDHKGNWLLKVRNSWSEKWGLGGFYWIDSRFIDHQENFEGFALKMAAQDPLDPNIAPPVA